MKDLASFDEMCDDYKREFGEPVPCGELFAQWLADTCDSAVVGGPVVGEAPSVVAIPSIDLPEETT